MDPVNPDNSKKNPTPKIVFESEYDRNPLSFLSRPWVQKTVFWIALLGVLLYLRSFFALFFLTFLFSVLMEAVVQRTPNLVPSRHTRVVMVFLLLLGFWGGLGYFLVPRVTTEFKRVLDQLPRIVEGVNKELNTLKTVNENGGEEASTKAADSVAWKAEGKSETGSDEVAEEAPDDGTTAAEKKLPGEEKSDKQAPREKGAGTGEKKKPSKWAPIIEALSLDEALSQKKILEYLGTKGNDLLGFGTQVLGHLTWAATVFLLSLIFSFIIVWDFPRLVRAYYGLEERTRAGPFFQVVRETFSPFGRVLAQALGAQTVIALVNTALTAIGMAILGIPSIEVLSVIVFLCSFIPVAGVFISSTPICFVTLGNNGIGDMMLFIGIVTIVHFIEAYILNPRIYGAHLHMHPLVVLVLLVISYHLLGLWGLLLATPVTAYLFHYVLKKPENEEGEDTGEKIAAKET